MRQRITAYSEQELTKIGDVDVRFCTLKLSMKYINVVLKVYISKPADYPHSPSKLLLYLTGGTGHKSINNQLQADKFASEGFLVVVPDQYVFSACLLMHLMCLTGNHRFGGDLAPGNKASTVATAELSLLERVKAGIADVGKSFMIDTWLARQTPEKVLPILHKVIEAAKDEFADAIANGGGIYAVGYCVGARYLLLLGGADDDETQDQSNYDEEEQAVPAPKGPYIKAGAIAHAAQVAPMDLANLKVPTLLICVENDPLFPSEIRQGGVEALEKGNIKHELKVYPEVPHGFAVVGEYADPKIKEAQQQAYTQMLGWLQAH